MQEEIVPLSYLRRYSARYPDAWPIAEEIRARRGSVNGFTAWPDWCYLPTSYVEPIVAEDRSSQTSFSLERIGDKMILAGLCAWRMGKGIYRFDPDLLEALWHTPVSGDIPGEVLLRLPEWCVYLELPDKTLGDNMRVNGCFAFLNSRLDRAELCLVAETPERRLLPAAPIVLGKTIEDGLRESMGGGLNLPSVAKIAPAIAYAASPIISLCLYLCSEEPDLAGLLPKMPERPTHPLPTKIKGGQKTFAADSARGTRHPTPKPGPAHPAGPLAHLLDRSKK